jgi:hypothetical protein
MNDVHVIHLSVITEQNEKTKKEKVENLRAFDAISAKEKKFNVNLTKFMAVFRGDGKFRARFAFPPL